MKLTPAPTPVPWLSNGTKLNVQSGNSVLEKKAGKGASKLMKGFRQKGRLNSGGENGGLSLASTKFCGEGKG